MPISGHSLSVVSYCYGQSFVDIFLPCVYFSAWEVMEDDVTSEWEVVKEIDLSSRGSGH